MTTVVLGTPPPELEALLERRRRAGVDRLDEVWQGVLHVVPGPSLEHARISTQLASCSTRRHAPPGCCSR